MAAVHVDRAQSDAMNLQVLKRQDDDVMEIVDTASHVVMYEFDQDNQNWKRKEVEGCLFVVKRFSAPRFQIFVNNRLSTTNMTLAIDENLQVDSVDTFLILRCPDASYASGYAIYGVWFFPEEDREKILNLLHRVIHSLKDVPAATNGSVNGSNKQASQPKKVEPKKVEQQQQPVVVQEPQQPVQPQQQPRARSRSRNKRDDSNGRRQTNAANSGANATQPTMILQRSPKNGNKASGLPPTGATATTPRASSSSVKQEPSPQAADASSSNGMVPISREDGIAAGEAILDMISQNRNQSNNNSAAPSPQKQQAPKSGRGRKKQQQQQSPVDDAAAPAAQVNKEQLKQTLIALLDDAAFFDQIYHAYVNRVHK
uniref:mRNA-decapping enzyme C-terminal domain-containing protein n=1 Tax=Globisporangium ultimum (strain ATCC 200006 / CBS 805.95 / DAOM BR144) TaxID=431595 RepID=K3WE81_GLOUD